MKSMLDAVWQNVRYALRLVRLNPMFALVAVASLALGTGANTAIFQLLDAVRLRTLPVKVPQELAELHIDDMTNARGNWLRDNAMTNPLWEKIRERQRGFSGMLAWADTSWTMSTGGEIRRVAGLWISGDFFRVLGVKPILGRVFSAEDDRRGCGLAPGAVISYGFWQREYGGDRSIIGRKVAIGDERIEVIGVTPPEFYGLEVGRTFDMALPICSVPAWLHDNRMLDSGTTWWLTVMGRLKPGVSIEQASSMARSISAGVFESTLPPDYPAASVKPYLAMKLLAAPAGGGISRLRDEYSTPLALLLAIAAFVLLIACANLANLMLARASAREREMAVRLAVGASRARLVQQLLTEGLLLAVAGAALGLLLSQALSRFLLSFLVNRNDPMFVDLDQDWRVFAFSSALAVATCVLLALAPALRAARTDAGGALKSGGRSMTSDRERVGLRRVLVASQVALSLVLLVGSLLFVRSLRNLMTLDPGFDPHNILFADVFFGSVKLAPDRVASLHREILERLRVIPGVEAAAEVTLVPLTGAAWNNRMWMEGSDFAHARAVMRSMIGTGYFPALKTALVAGRDFDEHDMGSSSKAAIVSEAFTREFSLGRDAVGKRFFVETTPFEPQTEFEIVGVVKDAKYHDLREPFQPVMFVPLQRIALERMEGRFMIRARAALPALTRSVGRTMAGINPNMSYSFHGFDEWIGESLVREKLMATLSSLFGALALLLTIVGLYGVISYTVARRTNEIGVRIALGAARSSVVALILREAAVVLAAGLGAGAMLALVVGRAAGALLFGLESYDPITFLMAAAALAFVVAAASGLPAWRASNVNPMVALREE